jgi:hypothetical protein
MASTQDEVNRTFLAVAGQQMSVIGNTNAMLADVLAQLQEVRNSVPVAATASKTSTTTTASTDGGVTAGSVLSTVLTSGFGLVPLISGLVGLFSGGDTTAPAPLVKYALPAAADFQAAESGGQVSGLDYDQMGMPRSFANAAAASGASSDVSGQNLAEAALGGGASFDVAGQASAMSYAAPGGSTPAAVAGAAPQITVNVQAMDARSFMDRSGDIALAVRDAMLNLNAINDVVNEL